MHRRGRRVLQIEPYLEHLLTIQMRLADGEPPHRVSAAGPSAAVYAAEKAATGALIDFYQVSAAGDLDAAVDAVLLFAATDARRFRLRDRMRAEALRDIGGAGQRIYVEAGVMHLSMIRHLAAARRPGQGISVVHLQAADTRRLCGRPYLLAPGDRLTFAKIFGRRDPELAQRLLAARSLVYSRIIETSEMTSPAGGHPHLTDEHRCITMVQLLDMAGCRALYPHLIKLPAATGREMVAAFIERYIKPAGPRHP
jgi:hypothetical protein